MTSGQRKRVKRYREMRGRIVSDAELAATWTDAPWTLMPPIQPEKRRVAFALPPRATPADVENLTGPDGSRWRVEMVSESEAVAHGI